MFSNGGSFERFGLGQHEYNDYHGVQIGEVTPIRALRQRKESNRCRCYIDASDCCESGAYLSGSQRILQTAKGDRGRRCQIDARAA